MSKATTGMMSTKWQNSAARRRCHAKFRAKVCRIAGVPYDSWFTTAELVNSCRTTPARVARAEESLGLHLHKKPAA